MQIMQFSVASYSIIEFSKILDKFNLTNAIVGTENEYYILIQVRYSLNQKELLTQIKNNLKEREDFCAVLKKTIDEEIFKQVNK